MSAFDRSRIVIESGPFVRAYLQAIQRGTKSVALCRRAPLTLWTVQDALRRLSEPAW